MIPLSQVISKKIGRAIFDYKMIKENDKILVAVSGGKDSLVMLYDLIQRRKSFPIHYDIVAAHIKTDFDNGCQKSVLEELFQKWGVDYRIVNVSVIDRLKPGKKMNCYWCSTQRRIELMNLSDKLGCNKVALGHHLDDIVETFLMNICLKGQISTMLPVLEYKKFPHTVIRPLALVPEHLIVKFTKLLGIDSITCKCPYGTNSGRKEIKEVVKLIVDKNKFALENIFKAMHNVKSDFLINQEKSEE